MEKVGVLGGSGGGCAPPVIRLPPGFRFHPTDEELVMQYLRRKVLSCPLPASIIPDIELSRFDPWDIPVGAAIGSSEKEKYFFNRKEAKYRIGSRANRAAGSGYWKATGRDRPITTSGGNNQVVGIKKFLVFYRGKPPHGSRTDWVMHEYYLTGPTAGGRGSNPPQAKSSTTYMGDWVLCYIFQKKRADGNEASSEMIVEPGEDQVMTARGRIRFIDFMGRRDADSAPNSAPRPMTSESSCLTDLSSESNSEEEANGHSTTSPLFPLQ